MLRYLLDLGQDTAWSGSAAIRSLVEIAGQLHAAGETGHALDALEAASARCWWETPDQQTRDLVARAADLLSVPAICPVCWRSTPRRIRWSTRAP